ncbi:PhzF family phenazine biosynthesis protein [bacterium]|nr:PhzF family phenazine biosynthesis protein [bacterium]
MAIPIFQVDSFTDIPFKGNPAGVCLLSENMEDTWMQNVAAEMNLAETAFLLKQKDGWDLRWFTPAAEVELCGHATLAAAHILWELEILPDYADARFHTLSGLLTATRKAGMIQLDFPATPAAPAAPLEELGDALGIDPVYTGKNRFDYLVEASGADEVRNCRPDMRLLAEAIPARGVMITAASDRPEYDFISRFFAPSIGIDEDPVTGSAHCCLGPYWSAKLGKTALTGYQASARGGAVAVRIEGERVLLRGRAVTVIRGELSEEV